MPAISMPEAPAPEPASSTSLSPPPHFLPQDWDDGRWGMQSWLERTGWRTLRDTRYGRRPDDFVHPALHDDPLLRKVYLLDLALFVAAERVSYRAVAGMVGFAPDEAAQIQLGTQVFDEARHYEVFCHRMAELGVTPERREALVERHTPPALKSFYDLILEQVDRKDFVAATLAQNLVLEGMAYPVYRYEIKYWSKFDQGLARTIKGAFADESHHTGFGEAVMAALLRRGDLATRNRALALMKRFETLMNEAFAQIIKFYIGLYQECANQYRGLVGDVEIFPGHTLGELDEEAQTRLLHQEIAREHRERMQRIGLE